jgi:DDE superfamily endonuclease
MRVLFRNRFSAVYLNNSPKDSDGAATGNGLVNENILLSYLHHFIKHSNCSLQNPVMLILNDHGHLLSFAAIDLAKKNGITLLALPPECGKELQPLDVSVFAPLLIHFSAATRRWADRNENEMLSIHDIPGLVNEILSDAVKPERIVTGFNWIGLQPLDSDASMDDPSFSFDDQPQQTAESSKQSQRMRRARRGRRLTQTISSRTLPRRSIRKRQKREAAVFASKKISIHFSLLETPVYTI